MLCDICKKEKASIYFTQVINGKVTKMHFCESCAEKKGIGETSFFSSFALAELLAGLVDLGIVSKEEKLKCAHCGLSYHEFKSTGLLGCGECYKTFRTNLIPLLRQIHGKIEHTGSVPEMLSLQRELQEAITREEYERAAQIRDKIHAIRKEKGN